MTTTTTSTTTTTTTTLTTTTNDDHDNHDDNHDDNHNDENTAKHHCIALHCVRQSHVHFGRYINKMTSTTATPFGPAPNLTEHFKQALNMTRNQFQSGSNPLGASTQMGVNAPQFSNFGTPQNGISTPVVPLTTTVDGNFEAFSTLQQPQGHSDGITGWIKSNSTLIIIISSVVIIGLGFYFVWLKYRKSPEHFTQGQVIPARQQIDSSSIGRPFFNFNDVSQSQSQQFTPQRPLSQQRPPQLPPQTMSSIDEKTDNIRGNEQQMSQRGAEFANPSFVSQMIPVSTRISSPSQPPAQQQQAPQPPAQQQFQQQPAPTQAMQIPINQPVPTQSMQIPISQPVPTQSMQIPIPPPPIVPVSDPNFTALS